MADESPSVPEAVLVSACLLGRECTYKATSNADEVLADELARAGVEVVPFCPEEAGGLGTPRPPADLTDDAARVLDGEARVLTHEGRDVTRGFLAGAEAALEVCRQRGIARAFLKERSPSCGCRATHVDGEVRAGRGVTAELLERHGVRCTGIEGRRARGQDAADAT